MGKTDIYCCELKSNGSVKDKAMGSFGYVAAWADVNSPLYENCEIVIRRARDGHDSEDM